MSTVNDELRSRNQEVTQINNDLTNLFAGIDFAVVVIIGSDLSIRRFTPQAQKLLGLIPADVGRPLTNINPHYRNPRIAVSGPPGHGVITDRKGARYQLRILPYRTVENKIDGAIITIIDISSFALPNPPSRPRKV